MLDNITWPQAVVILGILIFMGFMAVCALVLVTMRMEDR